MKATRIAVISFAVLVCSIPARAHEIDPGGRIEVNCVPAHTVRMAEIARAVENSHYWAPQYARKEMLTLARDACTNGARTVSFVPPDDQRYLPRSGEARSAY